MWSEPRPFAVLGGVPWAGVPLPLPGAAGLEAAGEAPVLGAGGPGSGGTGLLAAGAGGVVVAGGSSTPEGSSLPDGTEIPTVPSTVDAAFCAGSGSDPADASPPVTHTAAATATAAASRTARDEDRCVRRARGVRCGRWTTTAAAICSTASRSPAHSVLSGAERKACRVNATPRYSGGASPTSTAPVTRRSTVPASSSKGSIPDERPTGGVMVLHPGSRAPRRTSARPAAADRGAGGRARSRAAFPRSPRPRRRRDRRRLEAGSPRLGPAVGTTSRARPRRRLLSASTAVTAGSSSAGCSPKASGGMATLGRRASRRRASIRRFLAIVNIHARNCCSSPRNDPRSRAATSHVSASTSSACAASSPRRNRRSRGWTSRHKTAIAHCAPSCAAASTGPNSVVATSADDWCCRRFVGECAHVVEDTRGAKATHL